MIGELETAEKEKLETDKKKNYTSFLMSFSQQLDFMNSAEATKYKRPHLSSDDNICLTFSQVC